MSQHPLSGKQLPDDLFRAAVDAAPNGLLAVDERGKIFFANKEAETILGYTVEELIEMNVDELLPPDLRAHHQEQRNSFFTRPTRRKLGTGRDLHARRKDGAEVPVEIGLSPFSLQNKPVVLCSIVDISERRSVEAQLRAAQRMEAVGRLAGGVAHDFNNLLTAILCFGRFVQDVLHKDDPSYQDQEEVLRAAEKAKVLTQQLLAFSRRRIVDPRVVSINEAVTGMERMLRRIVGEDVDLECKLASSLWNTRIDASALEQVIINLAVNSRDAMPTGGKLTLETLNAALGEEYGRSHGVAMSAGDYVVLAVSDNGMGMDQETQLHIFEPFFTTKGEGKGTGLGLSTCYGIVKQAGGWIWVYSETGRGSTFKVYLPRVEEATQPVLGAHTAAARSGSETILVVEDDDQVRRLTVRSLTKLGYRVLEAANGGEALLIAETHQGPIHLIITDVVMPNMGGKQLVTRIAALLPGTRVLYVSGYTANAIVHHGVLEPGIAFLAKPFTSDVLGSKVREMLDEGEAGDVEPARPRILLVDDDPQVLRAAKSALKDSHYDVLSADSGRAALDLIAAHDFALILSDILMPDMSGPELYEAAQAVNPRVATRFVFVTGNLDHTFVKGFLQWAARPIVEKPIAQEKVATLLRAVSIEQPKSA